MESDRTSEVAKYTANRGMTTGYIMGGTARIEDSTVRKVFQMTNADEITVK